MKVVIVEDELPAADQLRKELERLDAGIEVLAVLGSVAEAADWMAQNPPPDLLFMDISLGDGLSFHLFDTIPPPCPVTFITAYDEYWQQAFEYYGIDYLLKPLKPEKLEAAIRKLNAFRKLFTVAQVEALRDPDPVLRGPHKVQRDVDPARQGFRKRFLVKKGLDYCSVRSEDVAYFYAAHKLVCLVSNEGQKFLLDQSLAEIEKQMNPSLFFRLNRKYLVQLPAIRRIVSHTKGKLQVELGPPAREEIIVSPETASAFKRWMDQ